MDQSHKKNRSVEDDPS